LYEHIRLASRQLWRLLRRFVSTTLLMVVTVLVMVSCALLVYLAAGLLARLVLWVGYSP
jgi:hypothetical protein